MYLIVVWIIVGIVTASRYHHYAWKAKEREMLIAHPQGDSWLGYNYPQIHLDFIDYLIMVLLIFAWPVFYVLIVVGIIRRSK